MKGWYSERPAHSLAARGIKVRAKGHHSSKIKNTKQTNSKAVTKPKIIVDLDGSVANIKFRVNAAKMASKGDVGSDKYWSTLFSSKLVKFDRPIEGTAMFLTSLEKKYDIVYVTGRPTSMARATNKWLSDNDFPKAKVHYRPPNESTCEFKEEVFSKMDNVALSIGDGRDEMRAARTNKIRHIRIRENKTWDERLILRRLDRYESAHK